MLPRPRTPLPSTALALACAAIAAAENDAEIESVALAPAAAAVAPTLFSALPPDESGIDFVNPIDTGHPLERIYLGAFACGGVAIGDLDGDGTHDLFLTSGPRPNRLYRGLGALKFADATAAAGLALPDGRQDRWAAGATLVDIDADADLDIHICYYDSPNELWVNDGKGRFVEKAGDFGLAISDASLMASFCDYDRDGDLDCFLLTRDFKRAGGRPKEHPIEKIGDRYRIIPPFDKYYDLVPRGGGRLAYVNAGREDYLLRNEGGKFVDVSNASGISGRDRGNSATWWDFDEDGLPDIYVGNDFKDADRLYQNNGDGTFTDVIRKAATHTPWFSMGADIADFDGDGRTDFLIADMAGTNHYRSKTTMGEIGAIRPFLLSAVPRQYMHNVLYLNNGTGSLTDAAYLAGLASSDWCWAVKCGDFDLDGRPDVFFTNGVSRSFNNSDDQRAPEDYIGQTEWDYYEPQPPRKEQNLAFANRGDMRFEDVSKAWGLDHLGMSYAAATGDLDGDGDLDLVTANLDDPVIVYRNNSPPSLHRIVIRLRARGNTFGLGARIEVNGGQTQVLRPATGFLSCNAPEFVVGLGAANAATSLKVTWPSGHRQEFENLAAGRRYTIHEPAEPPPPRIQPRRRPPMFANVASPSLRVIRHRERPYDDFARQPLLPYKHSQLGPGLAWADVDGDGDADFYLSAAAGQAGRIARNDGNAVFAETAGQTFAADAACEDLGAVFFDADKDGDPDLYVVSGGVECGPGDAELQDRLYLNDGAGAFRKAARGIVPERRDSGSCAVAADYDRDGDLDLFVGGRVVPGAYPETPASCLLRNDSRDGEAKLTDVTNGVAGLGGVGLVTAALWSDANGDGWTDLLVCCEWGPVKLFLNREGELRDATAESGLATHLGWWNGIAGADLDGDGDIDYIATNAGLNTPYKASAEKPELLYYGDFDGSGKKRIIEAKFEGDTCYPRRGFSCSSLAMPGLRERLKTFHQFASSSLAELYTDSNLSSSLRLEANTLASCALINDGDARFEMRPLPRAAQMAPCLGAVLSDFDADGKTDALLGQNFYAAQPETGLLDGGLSVLLRGDGEGGFEAVEPTVSGIVIRSAVTSVSCAQLNGDARPELVFTTNGGGAFLFSEPAAGRANRKLLELRLSGAPANPTGIGARVTVRSGGGSQTAELSAGSGYLSQSEPALWFGLGPAPVAESVEVEVHWPDGQVSQHQVATAAGRAILNKPR